MTTTHDSRYVPLAHADWHHVEKIALEDFQPELWYLLDDQRRRAVPRREGSLEGAAQVTQ